MIIVYSRLVVIIFSLIMQSGSYNENSFLIPGLILFVLVTAIILIVLLNRRNTRNKNSGNSNANALDNKKRRMRDKIVHSESRMNRIIESYKTGEADKTGNEKTHKTLNKQLRELTVRLQHIREEERTRIAREIHDELGQQLTAIKMDLAWIKRKHAETNTELKEKTESLLKLVDDTMHTVRKIATDLRPGILDDLGLDAAIEWQCTEFERRYGIKCRFNSSLGEINFNKEFSTMIFRILQETLTNIVRHSGASRVDINMNLKNNILFLEVKDNGAGITNEEVNNVSSLGLLGMKERAYIFGGEISFSGIQGQGTTVKLKIPLPASGKNVLTEP